MVEKITLELPDEVLKRAQVAANRSGQDVQAVIMDWITRGAELDVAALLNPNVEYPIYTPFGNEEAAQVLRDTLKAHQMKNGGKAE